MKEVRRSAERINTDFNSDMKDKDPPPTSNKQIAESE